MQVSFFIQEDFPQSTANGTVQLTQATWKISPGCCKQLAADVHHQVGAERGAAVLTAIEALAEEMKT